MSWTRLLLFCLALCGGVGVVAETARATTATAQSAGLALDACAWWLIVGSRPHMKYACTALLALADAVAVRGAPLALEEWKACHADREGCRLFAARLITAATPLAFLETLPLPPPPPAVPTGTPQDGASVRPRGVARHPARVNGPPRTDASTDEGGAPAVPIGGNPELDGGGGGGGGDCGLGGLGAYEVAGTGAAAAHGELWDDADYNDDDDDDDDGYSDGDVPQLQSHSLWRTWEALVWSTRYPTLFELSTDLHMRVDALGRCVRASRAGGTHAPNIACAHARPSDLLKTRWALLAHAARARPAEQA